MNNFVAISNHLIVRGLRLASLRLHFVAFLLIPKRPLAIK